MRWLPLGCALQKCLTPRFFLLNEYTVGIDRLLRLTAIFTEKVCSAAQLRSLVIRESFTALNRTGYVDAAAAAWLFLGKCLIHRFLCWMNIRWKLIFCCVSRRFFVKKSVLRHSCALWWSGNRLPSYTERYLHKQCSLTEAKLSSNLFSFLIMENTVANALLLHLAFFLDKKCFKQSIGLHNENTVKQTVCCVVGWLSLRMPVSESTDRISILIAEQSSLDPFQRDRSR